MDECDHSFPLLPKVLFFPVIPFLNLPFFLNATYHKLIGLRPLTVSNKIRIKKKKNFHKSFLKVG